MDDSAAPPAQYGCLAAFVATALAALLLTLATFPPMGGGSAGLYVPVFAVTTVVAATIGLPLYGLAVRFRRTNAPAAIAAGIVAGAALPLIGALSHGTPQAWVMVAAYGYAGAAGGLAFFLVATAPRAPLRNALVLAAITAVSIPAAVLTQPWLA